MQTLHTLHLYESCNFELVESCVALGEIVANAHSLSLIDISAQVGERHVEVHVTYFAEGYTEGEVVV